MKGIVHRIWLTVSEPRVLTACALLVYLSLFIFGVFIYTTDAYILDDWVRMFWRLSTLILLSTTPLAFAGAWSGLWMVERPALLGATLGTILASSISLFFHMDEGPAGAVHLITIVLVAALAFTRWVRITSSYIDPTRRVHQRTA